MPPANISADGLTGLVISSYEISVGNRFNSLGTDVEEEKIHRRTSSLFRQSRINVQMVVMHQRFVSLLARK